MSLLSYPAVRPWARAIKTKVVAREMPPWFADPHAGPQYTTDRSLQQSDIDLIAKWVDSGAPEGDAKDAPPPVEWPKDGWVIQPDYVVRGPSFKVPGRPPSNVIEWTVIIVPTGFTKDTWITSVEIKPSDLQVTHHICIGFSLHHDNVQYYTPVWADKPRDEEGVEIRPENGQSSGRARDFRGDPADEGGETSGGCYLPGNQAFDYRPFNAGRLIPAGANIVIAQHYTPSGKDSVDFPQIGFTIAKETPKYRWVSGQVELRRPARDSAERAELPGAARRRRIRDRCAARHDDAAHARPRTVDVVHGGDAGRPEADGAERAAVRLQLADAIRAERADRPAEGIEAPRRRQLQQFGVEQVQPEPEPLGVQRQHDVGRNDVAVLQRAGAGGRAASPGHQARHRQLDGRIRTTTSRRTGRL